MQRTYPRCLHCGKVCLGAHARYCSRRCSGHAPRGRRQVEVLPWAVYCSDLRQPEDRLVRYVACRVEAVELSRELNLKELARHKGKLRLTDGTPTPLFYAQRTSEQ